jgi:hypothetical protein
MSYGSYTDPDLNPIGSLNFGGYNNYKAGMPYFTPPAPVAAPTVAPVTTGISTKSAPTIPGLTDPLSQSLASFGIGGVIDPTAASTAAATAANPMAAPAAGQGFSLGGFLGDTFLNEGGGLNMDALTSAIGSIGSIYGAFKQFGLMKDSLDFSKKSFETNLENSRKSYNTALEDRISSRASYTGQGDKYVNDSLKKHSL